jgi:hypothetical protein
MLSLTRITICTALLTLSFAGSVLAAAPTALLAPKPEKAISIASDKFPENFGLRVGMTLAQVKAVVPDISKYVEVEARYNLAYSDQQGFEHYSFTPSGGLAVSKDKLLPIERVRLFFDKDSILILMIMEKNGYSSQGAAGGEKLKSDSKDLFDLFVKQNGEPFAKYINYSDELVKKHPSIFACLQAQIDVDSNQIKKRQNEAKEKPKTDEPAQGEELTDKAKTEQKAIANTMKYLYGVDIGAKEKPSKISKEERVYLDQVAATCVFRNRASISDNGEAIGLAQLDILPVDDESAIMLYEVFSRMAYRRYVEAMRTLSYGRQ